MLSDWAIIIAMGMVTFAIRLSVIGLSGRMALPVLVKRALRFVPPAVLSAIIVPQALLTEGRLNLSLHNPRLLAGALAALVAWRTKNVLLTIAMGMAVLWTLQWLKW